MKKLIALVLVAIMAIGLVACSGSEYKDGTYRAEYAEASHGWKTYLEITISGGKITAATLDAAGEGDNAGKVKSSLSAEQYGASYGFTHAPSDYLPTYSKSILAAGTNPDKVEMISGCTNTGKDAQELLAACLTAAKKGDTAAQVVAGSGNGD